MYTKFTKFNNSQEKGFAIPFKVAQNFFTCNFCMPSKRRTQSLQSNIYVYVSKSQLNSFKYPTSEKLSTNN
ncbi:unnamed protein product [Ceratitis capitata]|uniref:(Mediterranean fruit fly) hypothetical protein n=1 Tax=Ceratitis capitata TaxID=7213 RepID=A0A811U2Y9_CERCA|nr:unnamed protein product [Ceratitis capitata]